MWVRGRSSHGINHSPTRHHGVISTRLARHQCATNASSVRRQSVVRAPSVYGTLQLGLYHRHAQERGVVTCSTTRDVTRSRARRAEPRGCRNPEFATRLWPPRRRSNRSQRELRQWDHGIDVAWSRHTRDMVTAQAQHGGGMDGARTAWARHAHE